MIKKFIFKSSVSFLMILLFIGMTFAPIVNAQADELKNKHLEQEIEYIAEHSKILYETLNEQIIVMETIENEIIYGVLKRDDVNQNRIYFTAVSQNDLQSLFTSKQNNLISQNISSNQIESEVLKLNNVFSDNFICSDDTLSIIRAAAASSVGFGRGSYAENYGNSVTGGVHVYLSPIDASDAVLGSTAILGLIASAIVLLSSGSLAVPAALVGGLAYAIQLYYVVAKNNDGSLDINMSYAAVYFYTLGINIPGLYITLGVGSRVYKYFIS
ncbi:MAG: hypothetical protein RBQ94_03630 [Methanimicrococcus sp.]|nr:hypothetical protein [Methanimicrococcus sp.]